MIVKKLQCIAAWTLRLLLGAAAAMAQPPAGRPPSALVDQFSGGEPYCGVYSLYAAACKLNMPMSLRDLVKPEYIGSTDGSSMDELRDAAEAHGMHTMELSNLTVASLRRVQTPIILHVLSDSATGKYDHWILYLGERDGKIQVFDPPLATRALAPADLLEVWDGTALFLSTRDLRPLNAFSTEDAGFIGGVIFLIGVAAVGGRAMRRRGVRWPLKIQLAMPVAAALLFGVPWSMGAPQGLFGRPEAGRKIVAASARTLCPRVDVAFVREAVRSGNDVIVDARINRDFDLGHLPGARNIPVTDTLADVAQAMGDVAPEKPTIVYCESSGCAFASIVAGKIIAAGHPNVCIFTDGWQGWEAGQ